MRIRAVQGHRGVGSHHIRDEEAQTRLTADDHGAGVCVHGNTFLALESIISVDPKRNGLHGIMSKA